MKFTTLAAAAALALAPMAASAVTTFGFNGGTVQFTQHNAANPVSFTGLLAPTSITDNVQLNVTGNKLSTDPGGCTAGVDCRRSPFEGMAAFGTGQYHSVQGGTGPSGGTPGGTITYDFGAVVPGISFLWGSPDTYNFLEFYLGVGPNPFATLGGTALINAGAIAAEDAVTIAIFGFDFDKVVFRSNPNNTLDAFEISNFSVIPLPAALLLFGTAFAGAGLVRRYGRKPAAA